MNNHFDKFAKIQYLLENNLIPDEDFKLMQDISLKILHTNTPLTINEIDNLDYYFYYFEPKKQVA